MNEDHVAQIQKRIEELPQDVQSAIASADFDQKIQKIGQKHSLHIDQVEKLGDEIMLVMLGFMNSDNFISNITTQVNVTPTQAAAIAADVNSEILFAIRESLKKANEEALQHTKLEHRQTSQPTTPIAPLPHPADMTLIQKTVTVMPPITPPVSAPQKPSSYKADPYREPPLP